MPSPPAPGVGVDRACSWTRTWAQQRAERVLGAGCGCALALFVGRRALRPAAAARRRQPALLGAGSGQRLSAAASANPGRARPWRSGAQQPRLQADVKRARSESRCATCSGRCRGGPYAAVPNNPKQVAPLARCGPRTRTDAEFLRARRFTIRPPALTSPRHPAGLCGDIRRADLPDGAR